ncbi:hypothetical protein AJ79_07804 [Helicocarpus griseus UAMH5409]|uniref:Beta-lactamase-related domain-containing protein n=1 Tax=Helicocarpus griseus UAMH5409 TaxID=1447875 RepID=A0A2B7WZ71_9EURO|nr:hypothetical protein AJ79_07804 [Helicocarpus griseus UAMH5409]
MFYYLWAYVARFLALKNDVLSIPSLSHQDPELGRLQALKPTIQTICSMSGTAGASIGVLHHGKVLYTDNIGYRDVSTKTVADSQTLYGIGSLTKSMVAVAVGQLVDAGKLSWTTPIKDILPDFHHYDPSVTNLTTVVDIMSHRAGFSGDISLTFQGDGDALLPADQLIPTINTMKMVDTFRSRWSYSSWGYSLAGLIVEKLSGLTLHEYLDRFVYGPLKMHHTTTQPSFAVGENVAEPYASFANATPVRTTRMEFRNTLFEAAAGTYTNVDDMLKYSAALLEAYQSNGKSNSTLKELDKIFSAQIPVREPSYRERSYALGWIRTQLPGVLGLMGDNFDIIGSVAGLPEIGQCAPSKLCFYHQGSTVGYYSFIALFPETQSAVVVLSNSIALTDSPDTIAQAVSQALFDFPHPIDYVSFTEKATRKLVKSYDKIATTIARKRQKGTKRHLNEYTGRYWNDLNNFVLEVTLSEHSEEDTLLLSFQGLKSQIYSLRHLANDTFEWSLTLDDEASRGRYHINDADYFIVDFISKNGNIAELTSMGYTFVKDGRHR